MDWDKCYRENFIKTQQHINSWEREYNGGFPSYTSGKTKEIYKKLKKIRENLAAYILSDEFNSDRFTKMIDQENQLTDVYYQNRLNDFERFINKYYK